jgi:hypothetical protein
MATNERSSIRCCATACRLLTVNKTHVATNDSEFRLMLVSNHADAKGDIVARILALRFIASNATASLVARSNALATIAQLVTQPAPSLSSSSLSTSDVELLRSSAWLALRILATRLLSTTPSSSSMSTSSLSDDGVAMLSVARHGVLELLARMLTSSIDDSGATLLPHVSRRAERDERTTAELLAMVAILCSMFAVLI